MINNLLLMQGERGEQMKKDKEWLKSWFSDGKMAYSGEYINYIINEMDEQEKVVVPQFVADWMEKQKEVESNLWHVMNNVSIQRNDNPQLWTWIWRDDNMDKFAKAWLDGYTVGEEQKYCVELIAGGYLEYYPRSGNFGITGYKEGNHGLVKLTEDRIKSLPKGDVLFKHFAIPVEE